MFNAFLSHEIRCGHKSKCQTCLVLIRQRETAWKFLCFSFYRSFLWTAHFFLCIYQSFIPPPHWMSRVILYLFSFPVQCHYFGQHTGYLVYRGTRCRTLLCASCKRQEWREQDQPAHHLVSRKWVTLYTYANQGLIGNAFRRTFTFIIMSKPFKFLKEILNIHLTSWAFTYQAHSLIYWLEKCVITNCF